MKCRDRVLTRAAAVLVAFLAAAGSVRAQAPVGEQGKPFAIEYYYKARWGHYPEFLRLFKKNHYPVLLKEKELGRILKVDAVAPVYHGTEDGRWDMRVTITWKDAATANDGFSSAGIVAELYPDKARFDQEEQRRFELLAAHWDLPVAAVPLDK